MKIRFQADADLNEDIVSGVIRRQPGIDFQTAGDAGIYGMDDPSVLAKAAAQGRVLVPHDRRTMPLYFGRFIAASTSPGVFVISQKIDIRSAIEQLVLI